MKKSSCDTHGKIRPRVSLGAGAGGRVIAAGAIRSSAAEGAFSRGRPIVGGGDGERSGEWALNGSDVLLRWVGGRKDGGGGKRWEWGDNSRSMGRVNKLTPPRRQWWPRITPAGILTAKRATENRHALNPGPTGQWVKQNKHTWQSHRPHVANTHRPDKDFTAARGFVQTWETHRC